jgi:hypothetical protein
MRRRTLVLLASGMLLSGCQLSEPTLVQPERRRHGLREVQSAQRAVDRQLRQHQRELEAARRAALRDSDS